MTQKSIFRWLSVLWLLTSQVAGAALVFAPLVVLLSFQEAAAAAGEAGMFNLILGLGYVLPVVFVGLGIAAWVMLARSKNAVANWLGLATLAPGTIMLLMINMIAP
ncbi:MAG TPA: hypothetical protein PKJ84_03985 [Anaerolineales bacterium]|nr:hypothetical protein [Anaerolineales bacterium]HNO93304.1 hypothetical protein [Anaerolineales bacterium]